MGCRQFQGVSEHAVPLQLPEVTLSCIMCGGTCDCQLSNSNSIGFVRSAHSAPEHSPTGGEGECGRLATL